MDNTQIKVIDRDFVLDFLIPAITLDFSFQNIYSKGFCLCMHIAESYLGNNRKIQLCISAAIYVVFLVY